MRLSPISLNENVLDQRVEAKQSRSELDLKLI